MQWRANLKLQQEELCKRQGSFSKVLISIPDMPACCDRGAADKMAAHCLKPLSAHKFWEVPEVDTELVDFWEKLDFKSRQALLTVDKKALFQRIRSQYCSRCFGLFVMRYDELKCSAQLDCPTCQEFYAGLECLDSGCLTLEEHVVLGSPFATFTESKMRERERELQFMTGDICGSGWQKKPGLSMCHLHTSPVPIEALTEYWNNLPEEHKDTLFSMREEDFVAELDAHMKYQLKICKDCRCNVMRAYKDLKPCARDQKAGEQSLALEICTGHKLTVNDGLVCVDGKATTEFFEQAEEVEDCNAVEPDAEDDYGSPERIRHAETPELAREALIDSVVLIFKSQVEVAFREQTAGHNALLLFVHLALQMMEEQLLNAFRELRAKQAEAELLEALEVEHKKLESKKAAKKKKKAALKPSGSTSDEFSDDALPSSQQKSEPSSPICTKCALLQDSHKSRPSKLCSERCTCKDSKSDIAQQSRSTRPSQPACTAIKVSHSHTLHSVLAQSPRRVLGRLCTGTGSTSGHSSSTNSLPHSPSSKGAADTGTPDSLSSQQTDDGWEVQQRSKRAAASLSDKHSFDSNSSSIGGQSRRSHSMAWQPALHSGVQSKDASVHQGHGSTAGTEVLHLSTGPVSYQPPPPPPPPRARVAAAVAAPSKPAVTKSHFGVVGSAWGTPAKHISASQTHATAWASAVQQVNTLSTVSVPKDTDRFSLFSHFPTSNGVSGLGALQQTMSEQPKTAGYELFGSTGASFTPVNPLLPVSLY